MTVSAIAKKDFKVYPIFVAKQYVVNNNQLYHACDDLICMPIMGRNFAWNNGGTPVNMFNYDAELGGWDYYLDLNAIVGNGAVLFRPVLIALDISYEIYVYINYNTTTKQMIIYYYTASYYGSGTPGPPPTLTISQPPPGYCITKTSLAPGEYAQVYPCSDSPAPVSEQYKYLFADRPIADKPTIYDNEIYMNLSSSTFGVDRTTFGYLGIPGTEVIKTPAYVNAIATNEYGYDIPLPAYQIYNPTPDARNAVLAYVPNVAPIYGYFRFFFWAGSMYWGIDDQNNLWFFANGPALDNGSITGYIYQAMMYNRKDKIIYGTILLGYKPFSDSDFDLIDSAYAQSAISSIANLGRSCSDTGRGYMICRVPIVAIYNNEGSINTFTPNLDSEIWPYLSPATLSYDPNAGKGTVVEIVEELIYDSNVNADEANNILYSFPGSFYPIDPNGLLSLDLPTVFMYPSPPDSPATYSIEVDSMTLSGNTLTVSGKISSPSLSIFNGVRAYVMCGGVLMGLGEGQINPDGTYSVSVNAYIGRQNPSDCQVVVMATSRNFDAVTGQVPPPTSLVPITTQTRGIVVEFIAENDQSTRYAVVCADKTWGSPGCQPWTGDWMDVCFKSCTSPVINAQEFITAVTSASDGYTWKVNIYDNGLLVKQCTGVDKDHPCVYYLTAPSPTPSPSPSAATVSLMTVSTSPSPTPSPTPTSQAAIAEPYVSVPLATSISPSPTPTETPTPIPSPTPTSMPSPTPTPSPTCSPILTTGVSWLDNILFCVGSYGITVTVALLAFIFVLMILYGTWQQRR